MIKAGMGAARRDEQSPSGAYGRDTTAGELAGTADLSGQRVVVTGASSGIGLETARALARAGADVLLGVRDLEAGEQAAAGLAPTARGEISVGRIDLRAPDSVLQFANDITGPVRILVANAGVSNTPDSHLANGWEVRFATNHLGHFLLAQLLLDSMSTQGARLVVVSSASHKSHPVRLDDLQWQRRAHNWGSAYGESKTANILFAQEATRRWAVRGVFANAVLPGTALTGLQRFHGEALIKTIGFLDPDGQPHPLLKSVEQAAATSMWAAVAPELDGKGGLVLEDCSEAEPVRPDTHLWCGFDPSVSGAATAEGLWEISLELIRPWLPEGLPGGH